MHYDNRRVDGRGEGCIEHSSQPIIPKSESNIRLRLKDIVGKYQDINNGNVYVIRTKIRFLYKIFLIKC